MKAKRIVSILLTGSMLLSLLPVSALAAAPVFDAPAQTTAKKAAPLVQEADASRSTEEEAATRSSRDLDAENSTSDSFTIDRNRLVLELRHLHPAALLGSRGSKRIAGRSRYWGSCRI